LQPELKLKVVTAGNRIEEGRRLEYGGSKNNGQRRMEGEKDKVI